MAARSSTRTSRSPCNGRRPTTSASTAWTSSSSTTLASNSPNTGSYNWLSTGPASTKMKFRVVAHDDNHATTDNSDANWQIDSYTIGVEDELPVAFALASPSPNPSAAGNNLIAFSVPKDAQVRLTIHDIRGRTVAKLVD